jgi:archaellum component FlaG (FlaF/FlaG flagellin family)
MKITWEVDDGYAGGSAPHTTNVDDEEIKDCGDIDEAMELIDDVIQSDYDSTITWYIKNRGKIIDEVNKILEEKEDE